MRPWKLQLCLFLSLCRHLLFVCEFTSIRMRLFLSIAILFWATVTTTVSSPTPSTIQGPSQGSSTTSALSDEDCLLTVDWQDIVFISAVPIAAGFGLLMLLAFLQDLRQARKSARSCPHTPPTIRGNRARKERTYVIGVDYAGCSHWGSFLHWCAKHKSSGARKSPRLVRLRGTIGFSDWLSFNLVLNEKSEQKIITTTRSIGKLVAVETRYPSASDRIRSRQLPSSNIGACLRGLINRECDIEIKNIHVTDTKTQDQFISDCGTSNGGISSSDLGITTILPLLPFVTKPEPRVNYIAYFITIASLLTSTFAPWHEGNFTTARHVTCLFAYVSYTMLAAQVMSELYLAPSHGEIIVASFVDFNVTMATVTRGVYVGGVVFLIVCVMEIVFRGAPTIWSLDLPCVSPRAQNENPLSDGSQPIQVQSAAGDFCGGDRESVEEGLIRKSVSAPERKQGSDKTNTSNEENGNDVKHAIIFQWTMINGHGTYELVSKPPGKIAPGTTVYFKDYITDTGDTSSLSISSSDSVSICAANMLECHHKFACHRCTVCRQITGSRYYDQGAGSSSGFASIKYNDVYGEGTIPNDVSFSSSLGSGAFTDASYIVNRSSSTSSCISMSSQGSNGSVSIGDSLINISNELLQESAHQAVSVIKPNVDKDLDGAEKGKSALSLPPSELSQHTPDYLSIATSTSGLVGSRQKNSGKQEAGDRQHPGRQLDRQLEIIHDDTNVHEGFTMYSDALKDANINSAKVIRTKNYINKFSDMGKGKVVFLTSDSDTKTLDEAMLKDKSYTKTPADILSSQCVSKSAPDTKCDPANLMADYIIDMAMNFEIPSVTVQSRRKTLLFSLRKWFGGLLFNPKVKVDNDYKLEVTENDVAIKTTDEIVHESTMDSRPNQISGIMDDKTKMNKVDDHLQGSIFQSSSHLIEYQPLVKGVASSNSWESISSAKDTFTPYLDGNTGKNKNNNSNEVTTIACSDDFVSMDSSLTKSSKDLSEDTNHRIRFEYYQAMHKAHPTANNKNLAEDLYQPVGFLICHILVIMSCVIFLAWSVFSVQGLCWSVFWKWVATSIIAFLFEVFVLDMIKAGILTSLKWYFSYMDAKPKPYSTIE